MFHPVQNLVRLPDGPGHIKGHSIQIKQREQDRVDAERQTKTLKVQVEDLSKSFEVSSNFKQIYWGRPDGVCITALKTIPRFNTFDHTSTTAMPASEHGVGGP